MRVLVYVQSEDSLQESFFLSFSVGPGIEPKIVRQQVLYYWAISLAQFYLFLFLFL